MNLEGGYTMVSGEHDGRDITDRVKGDIVRFTPTTVVVTDKDQKETYSATYTLDESMTPCKLMMVSQVEQSKGEKAEGLIEKTGDTVRLIYSLPGNPPPTEFKTKDKQIMVVATNFNK